MGTIAEVSKEIYTVPEHQGEGTYVPEDSLSHLTHHTFS